jgi:O-antigen/teichoic acid export membrane protein
LAFAVGAVALILLARNLLLSLFGTEFEHGVTALYVLLLAQVAVAVNGPAGIVASMTGCEGAAAKAYFIALVTVGSVTVVFYDRLGILAPALGVLAGTLLWGTLLRLHIARIVGVSTVPRISILRHAIRRSGS